MPSEILSTSTLQSLTRDVEAKHVAYSAAFEQHSNAELELGAAAAVRSSLVRAWDAKDRLSKDLRRGAVDAAIRGDAGFRKAAACLVDDFSELALLQAALHKFHAYEYCEALRAVLIAKVRMYEAQFSSEEARLHHRIAEIEHSLAPIAASNGGLQISLGGAVKGHTELVARIAKDLDASRAELRQHDLQTRDLQVAYAKEQSS